MNRTAAAFVLLAGCDAAGPPPHDWTFMSARADSWSEGSTTVRAEFVCPGYDDESTCLLGSDERLYVESDNGRTRVPEVDVDWIHEGDGYSWDYEAQTDVWESGDRLDIVYERDGYAGSLRIASLFPTPFDLTEGPTGEVSREDPIPVEWEPAEDPLATRVRVSVLPDFHDDCIHGGFEYVEDAGSYVVPVGDVNAVSKELWPSCAAYLRVYRCREGDADATLKGGRSEWEVCHARAMEFTTVP